MRQDWAERVPDLRQLAAVRRITLDDGAERGVRALSFDTGGGLAFWLLADRSLDIGPLSFRGMPLAWQHPAGFVAPGLHDAQADGGTGIQRALSGFLVLVGALGGAGRKRKRGGRSQQDGFAQKSHDSRSPH